jgi:hypothetical protein
MEYNYTREIQGNGLYNISYPGECVRLIDDISPIFPTHSIIVRAIAGDVIITMDPTLTTGEKTTLDTIVSDHKNNICFLPDVPSDINAEDIGTDEPGETVQTTISAMINTSFLLSSLGTATSGRYLDANHNIPTNKSPIQFTRNLKLKSLTIALESSTTGDIEILKNNSSIYTLSLSNESEKNIENLNILFEKDTKLSAKIVSGSFKNPILTLWYSKG